ncbi:homocysteine S-methyltransferase [Acidovorax sp. DW039]|uniref:homocysteine S-methyltransferase n=1 Tax=Acidovorax sp. DW039 TaxID=3095606 RepID=UPI003087047C|nr:homocysteine S-methyltransferase [Acidovorax sp. DW039]
MTSTPTANPLQTLLDEQGLFVLDGALATELERRGADLKDPLWSAKLLIEQPDLIRQVHLDYFLAGADVATTSSYQATFEAFGKRGYSAEESADLMRRSVTLACEARDAFWANSANRQGRRKPLVAASVGPYGAMLADGSEYIGYQGVSRDDLARFHAPRLQVLAAAGADLLACETLPCLDEALAIASLLPTLDDGRGHAPGAWISFSCKDGEHNSQGERIADCAAALDGLPQVWAVGVNCTAPQYIPSLVAHIQRHTRTPIVVYPNSGETYDAVDKQWRGADASAAPAAHTAPCDAFAEAAMRWHAQGARLIGGCCRTSPQDIAALKRQALSQGVLRNVTAP